MQTQTTSTTSTYSDKVYILHGLCIKHRTSQQYKQPHEAAHPLLALIASANKSVGTVSLYPGHVLQLLSATDISWVVSSRNCARTI